MTILYYHYAYFIEEKSDARMLSDLPKVKAKSQTDSTFLTMTHTTLLRSETHPFIQVDSGKCQPAHCSKTNDYKVLLWAVLTSSETLTHWWCSVPDEQSP